MTTARWAAKYVGIPFENSGFGFRGCNCIGLVHLVLKNEANIEIPTYAEISADQMVSAARAFSAAKSDGIWTAVSDPKPFDLLLMRAMTDDMTRIEAHVGIMASPAHVLHVWRATNSVLMKVDHQRVRNKMVGFYRHRQLI